MKEIKGDLIEYVKTGAFDIIVHGCNCFHKMGAGIAKTIKDEFPEAYKADRYETEYGDRKKLGTCTTAEVYQENGWPSFTIVNAYTQFQYWGKGQKVDYRAVRGCMQWIKRNFSGKRIGLPMIGAGLAGGDWAVISKIIDEELENEDVTLVVYDG